MRKLSMNELGRLSTASFKTAEKLPVTIILDSVRSGLNVGSVFRTADAFLIEKICLCGYTPLPPHRDILKSALGATESVDWQAFADVKDCITGLKQAGYTVWAVEQVEGSVLLPDFDPANYEKLALILGNEVSGVSDEALSVVDGSIEVPQWGTKHSLNISVCAGIVIWDIARRMSIPVPDAS